MSLDSSFLGSVTRSFCIACFEERAGPLNMKEVRRRILFKVLLSRLFDCTSAYQLLMVCRAGYPHMTLFMHTAAIFVFLIWAMPNCWVDGCCGCSFMQNLVSHSLLHSSVSHMSGDVDGMRIPRFDFTILT